MRLLYLRNLHRSGRANQTIYETTEQRPGSVTTHYLFFPEKLHSSHCQRLSSYPPSLGMSASGSEGSEGPDSSGSSVTLDIPDIFDPVNPLIPNRLRAKEAIQWTQDDVEIFLKHNKSEYGLKSQQISVIRKEKVSGRVLLDLTKNKLVNPPYKISADAAIAIQQLINYLKRKLFPRPKLQHPSLHSER